MALVALGVEEAPYEFVAYGAERGLFKIRGHEFVAVCLKNFAFDGHSASIERLRVLLEEVHAVYACRLV